MWNILEQQPEGKGMSAKAIITKLAEMNLELEESTLRKHTIPELKLLGVKNTRARGGYHIVNS